MEFALDFSLSLGLSSDLARVKVIVVVVVVAKWLKTWSGNKLGYALKQCAIFKISENFRFSKL